ncbi:MAG TPA: DNA repair protein RecN, partial [Chloroflexi bacterium]|nr:DNA repair protein RecN [Chloroflexota bacterium]
LSNIEKLIKFSNQLLEVGIESDSQSRGMSVVDQIGMMSEICERLIQIDANFQPIKSQVDSLFDQCQDVASDLFKYKDNIEFDPERFVEVEERLELISDLIGKYGSNIDEVIQYGLDIELKLENIASNADSIKELENQEKMLLGKIENLGIEITKKRKLTADSLASNVMERMSELRMDGTEFFIRIDHTDDDISGVTIDNRTVKIYENGLDTVEFLISPNKGESLKPISKIASGGETSRLMLALRGILAEADRRPILVFDEIDQGIGGRIGSVIGKNLWELGVSHQVVCITHLPSIASYGDAHYRVTKQMSDDRTYTVVESLDSESRIEEIIAMLGSKGKSVRKTALGLIENANKEKDSI